MIIDFRESDHTYRLNNIPVPSVTQAINSAGLTDFSGIPPAILEAARIFGKAVHKTTELHDRGILKYDTLDPKIIPYLEGWIAFLKMSGAEVIEIEKRVGSLLYMYAGTLDRILLIIGVKWIYDIKTAHDDHPATAIQTAGYQLANGDKKVLRRGGVLLKKDGSFRITHYMDQKDRAVFLSCLSIHNWKGVNKCK